MNSDNQSFGGREPADTGAQTGFSDDYPAPAAMGYGQDARRGAVGQAERLAPAGCSMSAARCPDSGLLAENISCDAATVCELLTELIGAGGESSNALYCALAVVSRMGMMADAIAKANGASFYLSDPLQWFVPSEAGRQAVAALHVRGGVMFEVEA